MFRECRQPATNGTVARSGSRQDRNESVMVLSNVKGQRREPATSDVRIATRRAGWLPFAGPSWFGVCMCINATVLEVHSL
jgi:hypothetical protein